MRVKDVLAQQGLQKMLCEAKPEEGRWLVRLAGEGVMIDTYMFNRRGDISYSKLNDSEGSLK